MRIDVGWSNPAWESRTDPRMLGRDAVLAGKAYLFHDERTFEDEWGVVRRVGSDGKHVGWLRGPLSETEKPNLSLVRVERSRELRYDPHLGSQMRGLKDEGAFTSLVVDNPFKTAWYLRGMQNLLMDYYLNPGFVAELYDRLVDLELPRLKVAVEVGVDPIAIHGDFAMQDRLLVQPDMWRRFDKVALAKMIDFCRTVDPRVRIFIHSDGNILSVMDDLVFDLGIDTINPMQPECMDLSRVKKKYGVQIVMCGGGSLQRTLPFGTVEDVRSEVREIIDRYGQNGGLVIMPSNMVETDVPVENVVAFLETARDYFPY